MIKVFLRRNYTKLMHFPDLLMQYHQELIYLAFQIYGMIVNVVEIILDQIFFL